MIWWVKNSSKKVRMMSKGCSLTWDTTRTSWLRLGKKTGRGHRKKRSCSASGTTKYWCFLLTTCTTYRSPRTLKPIVITATTTKMYRMTNLMISIHVRSMKLAHTRDYTTWKLIALSCMRMLYLVACSQSIGTSKKVSKSHLSIKSWRKTRNNSIWRRKTSFLSGFQRTVTQERVSFFAGLALLTKKRLWSTSCLRHRASCGSTSSNSKETS